MEEPLENKDLKAKYDEMHKQGSSSWFSDGWEERKTIIEMGELWEGLNVLEIGCGEGDLCAMMSMAGAIIHGVDYSVIAIKEAEKRFPKLRFNQWDLNTKQLSPADGSYDRIVMQGVLEHLDDPFRELKWMIDNLLRPGGDVITSSPCFLNPRGIVWMTLDMVGAVMSKTDLHFLHPWEFNNFCEINNYELITKDCDYSWGNCEEMIKDLKQRIPLALKDGNLKGDPTNLCEFLSHWPVVIAGATMVYKIQT